MNRSKKRACKHALFLYRKITCDKFVFTYLHNELDLV